MLHSFVPVLVLVFILGACNGSFFNCRRAVEECGPNGTCNGNGTCKCDVLSESLYHNCINVTAISTNCTKVCHNNGACIKVGGEEQCACDEEFTGDNCADQKMEVRCSTTSMHIVLRPGPTFHGNIYTENSTTIDKSCRFSNNSSEDIYELDIPLNDTLCGMNVSITDTQMQFTQKVRMLYSTEPLALLLDTDPLLQATCTFNSSVELRTVIGNITVDRNNDVSQEVQGKVDDLLLLTVVNESKKIVTENSPVHLGEVLTFIISLKDNFVYDSIKSVDITASPGYPADAGKTTLPIIKNSCSEAPDVLRNFIEEKHAVNVTISAFRFLDSSDVTFTISVVMCKSNNTDCKVELPHACNISSASGRRRRQSGVGIATKTAHIQVDDGTSQTSNSNVVVTPNEETNVEERYMGVNIETCLHNSDVQILVAILSAGVAVLLIFSVVITVCLLRKSNRKQVVDPDLQISGSSEICFPALSPVPVSSPPTSLSSSPPSSISPSPPTSLSSSPPSSISPSPPTSLSSSPPSSISPSPPTSLSSSPPSSISPSPPTSLSSSPPSSISPSPPISLSSSPPSSISPSPPSSISPSPPTPLSPLSPTSPPTSLITASSSSTLATNTISIATSDLAPTLPADTSPSRRRRDAGSLEMVFTERIHVNDETPLENNDNNVENTDEIKNKKENPNVNFETCLQNSDIQILVALLTAGLLILLVMCFVTIACLLRKSNRKQNFDPDSLSVTSSMQILYVPRVKI